MTDTYKILGQELTGGLALDGETVKETILYEVPENTQASISTIQITNSDVSSQTYKLAFVKDSEVEEAYTDVEYTTGTVVNRFLASNITNNILYSEDGLSWTETSQDISIMPLLAYGNETFVAVFPNNIAGYSSDGINWNTTTLPLTSPQWNSLIYAGNKFVAISNQNNRIVYSEDGVSWSEATNLDGFNKSIAYGDGKFVFLRTGSDGNSVPIIQYTENFLSTLVPQFPQDFVNWNSIAYGSGKFVAVRSDSGSATNQVAYSEDADNWNLLTIPNMFLQTPKIEYGDGKFVIINNSTLTSYYSQDGMSWSQTTIPITADWTELKYVNDKFIAVRNGSEYIYSEDGINWNLNSFPISGQYQSVTFGTIGNLINNTQSIPQSLNKHYAVYNKTIASGETHEIKGGITLSSGDQIRVYSDSPEIIANAYGVEIS
jgi:hypothetical protein